MEQDKPLFTKEQLQKAFVDGRLYEANELELDGNGETAFDNWFEWMSTKDDNPDVEPPFIHPFGNLYPLYNPKYGDDRMCKCGHPYYRHFDTYDDMFPCGCKYCDCSGFEEEIK